MDVTVVVGPAQPQIVYPPGTILLHMYMRERLAGLASGRFVEVGVGSGHLSQLLLACGWSGVGYDLSRSALARASRLNAPFIASGRYTVRNGDWLSEDEPEQNDLVVSSMVIEHLDDNAVRRYFERSSSVPAPRWTRHVVSTWLSSSLGDRGRCRRPPLPVYHR
jgi:SAM-dependent methyltransferase